MNYLSASPYSGMITYSDEQYKAQDIIEQYGFDPRMNDLSRARNWDDFVKKMNYCMMKQFSALKRGGRMFTLVGDWKQKGKLYSMFKDIVVPGTMEQVIIKVEHNCTSDSKSYTNNNFVYIRHEYVLVIKKETAIIIPFTLPRKMQMDMRDTISATWRDVVAAILEDAGEPLHLSDIYRAVDGHKKCERNPHWQDKIRQTLQRWEGFKRIADGVWAIA